MKGKDLFEHYVFLTVTDSSILNCDRTDFSTYSGYVTYIHRQLLAKRFDSINRYIFAIAQDIKEIYGMTEQEAVSFVVRYFAEKKWETYHQPVRMVRNHFGIFLSA